MLVTMDRRTFDAQSNADLAWACIEPTIRQVRAKSLDVKVRSFADLTRGQRALFMFWVLHGHSKGGARQLLAELAYLWEQPGMWSELETGMRYLQEEALAQLVDELHQLYRVGSVASQKGRIPCATTDATSPWESSAAAARLDAKLVALDQAVERIGARIRGNPAEYVQF